MHKKSCLTIESVQSFKKYMQKAHGERLYVNIYSNHIIVVHVNAFSSFPP